MVDIHYFPDSNQVCILYTQLANDKKYTRHGIWDKCDYLDNNHWYKIHIGFLKNIWSIIMSIFGK